MNAMALAVAVLVSAIPPFPPPTTVHLTDSLKCDLAMVVSVDAGVLRGQTTAGLVTYKIQPGMSVMTREGRPGNPISGLTAGTRVRVYYLIDNGANVQEIDLE